MKKFVCVLCVLALLPSVFALSTEEIKAKSEKMVSLIQKTAEKDSTKFRNVQPFLLSLFKECAESKEISEALTCALVYSQLKKIELPKEEIEEVKEVIEEKEPVKEIIYQPIDQYTLQKAVQDELDRREAEKLEQERREIEQRRIESEAAKEKYIEEYNNCLKENGYKIKIEKIDYKTPVVICNGKIYVYGAAQA